jgi:hypothetical protein
MRVSMKYNGIRLLAHPLQVEDYTVKISTGTADTAAPTAPTSLTPSGTTQTTTNLSWTASTDNVITMYQGATLKTSVTGTSYSVSGLTASTAYSFTVKAKDAAGNVSASSNTANVTTTASVGASDLLFSEYIRFFQ